MLQTGAAFAIFPLMLLSLITIYPCPGDESKIIDVLDSMQGLVTTKADCQGCFLTVEAITGKSIYYMERWRTREALDRHLRSPLYRQILEVIELSRTTPTFEFLEVKELGGLSLVEQARFLVPITENSTKENTIGHRDHLIGKRRLPE